MLSEVLHDLIGWHWHLLHVLLPEMVLPFDEVNHCLHVRLTRSIVSNSQCYTIFAKASRDSLKLKRNGLWVLPNEIALCPCLQDYQHEENKKRAHINKQVFRKVGLDY